MSAAEALPVRRTRALRPSDERFVVDSWVETYADSAVARISATTRPTTT